MNGQRKLSNNEEAVALRNQYGTIIDYITYDENLWPSTENDSNVIWQLKSDDLNNHLMTRWTAVKGPDAQPLANSSNADMQVFPNPTSGFVNLLCPAERKSSVSVYNI